VDVSSAIIDDTQLATKLYVDTHGGGGGGGNMSYVGTVPANYYIYKSSSTDGKSLVKSNIVDTGLAVIVNSTIQCSSLDGQTIGGNLNIGAAQNTVSIPATNGIISNKFVKSSGLPTQFLKADGSTDSNSYITNPTYNLGVSTLNNALTILPMTSDSLPSGYLATSNFAGTANFQAFDQNTATSYSSYANYSGLTGTYSGYIQTPLLPFGTLNGDWLQIEYPSPITVVGYTINSSVSLSQVPSTFTLLTSTDNVNWTAQDSEVAVQWVLGTPKSYTFPSITSKYFRLSVYLVGNTGTSSRTNFVINELTLTQNSASITVPTLISNKTTFTNDNELVSKKYVNTTPSIVAGYPFNPTERATTTITSSTKSYYFTVLLNRNTIISGFTVYLDSGSDLFRMGIFRGNNIAGQTITLCGQSAGGGLNATTILNRVAITAVSGQNLNFNSGEYITIAFHSQGSTNIFLGSPVATSISVELAWLSSSNYAAAGFPATLNSTAILGTFTLRPCFELY
jgi:hypothetical protein